MAHLPEKLLVLIFVLVLPSLVIWKVSSENKVLGSRVQVIEDYSSDIVFWQAQVVKHPDYRDGYLKLAEVYKKTGNLGEARLQVLLALQVDPNFQLPPQLVDLR